MYCIFCGSKLSDDAAFCHICGKAVIHANDQKYKNERQELKDLGFNVVISCESAHSKAYVVVQTDVSEIIVEAFKKAFLTLPLGVHEITFTTHRKGFTLIKTKDVYSRNINVSQKTIHYINVRIGQQTNRIDITCLPTN